MERRKHAKSLRSSRSRIAAPTSTNRRRHRRRT
jgi:hypothetical protein